MSCTQTVTYNSLEAPYTSVTYDVQHTYADGGTLAWSDWTVTVSGYLTADGDESVVGKSLEMRRLWDVPRRKFTVAFTPRHGGATEYLFDFAPFDIEARDMDVAWGPTPLGLRFGNVAGGLTVPYVFTIRARTKEAWTPQGVPQVAFLADNPMLSYTRAYEFGIDENGATNRTTSGKLTVARNLLGNGRGPSYVRDAVYPPLPNNFERKSATFSVSEDGLSATYRVTDVEVIDTLPDPITSGTADIATTTTADGGMADCTLQGEFRAARTTPKSTIVARIATLLGKYLKAGDIVTERSMSAALYGPVNGVRFSFRWQTPYIIHDPDGNSSAGALASLVVERPPGSTGKAKDPGPWGTANQTEYVIGSPYDPVATKIAQVRVDAASARLTGVPDGTPQPVPATAPGGGAGVAQPDMSAAHKATPILSYCVQYSYELKTGLKPYWPKVAGKGPIMVRHGPAALYVIVSGVMRYARRPTSAPLRIPDPPPGYVILEPGFSPENGQPIGAGEFSEYRVSWRYMGVKAATIEGGGNAFLGLNVLEPPDIRRATSNPNTRLPGPDSVVPA